MLEFLKEVWGLLEKLGEFIKPFVDSIMPIIVLFIILFMLYILLDEYVFSRLKNKKKGKEKVESNELCSAYTQTIHDNIKAQYQIRTSTYEYDTPEKKKENADPKVVFTYNITKDIIFSCEEGKSIKNGRFDIVKFYKELRIALKKLNVEIPDPGKDPLVLDLPSVEGNVTHYISFTIDGCIHSLTVSW